MINLKEMHADMARCFDCDRRKTRQINAPFYGLGNLNAQIMFVGESPGYQTRQTNGLVFCGNVSGDYFLEVLSKHGFNFGNSYFTNVVKCQCAQNALPSETEIAACRKFLNAEIKYVNPLVIVPVGNVATKWFLPNEFVSRASGEEYDWEGKIVFPIYHPAYILRNDEKVALKYEETVKKLKALHERVYAEIEEKRVDKNANIRSFIK